jgi:hypothetical protein
MCPKESATTYGQQGNLATSPTASYQVEIREQPAKPQLHWHGTITKRNYFRWHASKKFYAALECQQ